MTPEERTMSHDERDVFLISNLTNPKVEEYALPCLKSLLRNSLETLSLTIIIDRPEDKPRFRDDLAALPEAARHRVHVFDAQEAFARADDRFARYPNLRFLQRGHPCWRKVTDPLLFATPGREAVIIDPDVYFPNPFTFEPTPETGILIMHQPPNCLGPTEIVRRAFDAGIPMADHADIGVCHTHADTDLEWLDALIATLGGVDIPHSAMHVEPIIWSAMGMRFGGGYLNPRAWFCWYYSMTKRLRKRLGVNGLSIIDAASARGVKCFHATGISKRWLPAAEAAGHFRTGPPQAQPTPILPFVEYTRSKFEKKIRLQNLAQSAGIYKFIHSGT
jgi:hypothetical protein